MDDEYLQLDDVGENFAAEFSNENKLISATPKKKLNVFRTAKLVGNVAATDLNGQSVAQTVGVEQGM